MKKVEKRTNEIKIAGLLHFCGNLFSGGILGTILVVIYLFTQNNLEKETKVVIYEIINFNLSYYLYMIISFILCFVLVGIPMLIIGFIIWFFALVIGFIKHLSGENYNYPLTIKFLKL